MTPLRTRIAAAIESSGFRITIFDNRTRGTNRGQAQREHRLALGSVGCDGIVPRVMGSGHPSYPQQSLIRPTGSHGGFVHSAFTDPLSSLGLSPIFFGPRCDRLKLILYRVCVLGAWSACNSFFTG